MHPHHALLQHIANTLEIPITKDGNHQLNTPPGQHYARLYEHDAPFQTAHRLTIHDHNTITILQITISTYPATTKTILIIPHTPIRTQYDLQDPNSIQQIIEQTTHYINNPEQNQ